MQEKNYKPMLGKLFGSNARVKILKLFILHPNEKYYIRQIARDLRLQLNSVRRELENLEAFGLLNSHYESAEKIKENSDPGNKSEAKSDRKYFQVDGNFVIFDEVKSLIFKAQILYEKDFVVKLQKAGHTKLLIFTGMFVNNPNSIIDLLIVGKFNKIKLIKIIKDLETELGQEINFTVMEPKEFKYRRDITDVFLYNILEGKKLVAIDELGIIN